MKPPNTPTPNAQHFDDALRLFLDARLDLTMLPSAETPEEEEEQTRLIDKLTAAENFVLQQKAPDLRSVLAKLEVATCDGRDMLPDDVDSIVHDLMRLGELDRSPTFQPTVWLERFERAGGTTMLLKRGDDVRPVTGCPLDAVSALGMLQDLKHHERLALREHLLKVLDPADHGLEEA